MSNKSRARETSVQQPATDRGENWAVFAAVLFTLAGVFHIMWGLAALADDENFTADGLLFGDLSVWGIVYLVIGAAQFLAVYLLARSSPSGRWVGIGLAGLSAANAMLSFSAHPMWSAVIMALDLLVIYGLAVHGDRGR